MEWIRTQKLQGKLPQGGRCCDGWKAGENAARRRGCHWMAVPILADTSALPRRSIELTRLRFVFDIPYPLAGFEQPHPSERKRAMLSLQLPCSRLDFDWRNRLRFVAGSHVAKVVRRLEIDQHALGHKIIPPALLRHPIEPALTMDIPEDRWLKALGWIQEKGFEPKGALSP